MHSFVVHPLSLLIVVRRLFASPIPFFDVHHVCLRQLDRCLLLPGKILTFSRRSRPAGVVFQRRRRHCGQWVSPMLRTKRTKQRNSFYRSFGSLSPGGLSDGPGDFSRSLADYFAGLVACCASIGDYLAGSCPAMTCRGEIDRTGGNSDKQLQYGTLTPFT